MSSCWPENVGILAMELIFPAQYVDQTELETFDGVAPGKYTMGLGQQKMGFCNDREDVHSLCLTVVQKLLEKNNIRHEEIGRLEVGTETILDKSKSVKSVLMQLFEPHGVTDLEGVDSTNACYGGTAALFNSIAWVESSNWNGRYALAVAADIAVYAKGPARPTGGAGAVAMLIGPNAPLVFDRGIRSTYVKHAYDFYKPDLSSEFPAFDGKLSVQCYLSAVDNCYQSYRKNVAKRLGKNVDLNDFHAVIFHSPYGKLVQKSLARLDLNDYLLTPKELRSQKFPGLEQFTNVKLEDSYFDRDVEKAFLTHSQETFVAKTKPSLFMSSQIGNMYTPSVYGCLASLLISKNISELAGHKILAFSYGSGFVSSMFSITVGKDTESLQKIAANLSQIKCLLNSRQKVQPHKFEAALELKQEIAHKAPYTPVGCIEHFFPGTYYLTKIDEKRRRFYERVPDTTNGHI
ncbi:unnamed protein product [Acanthoscelides obtectus]|uniref:Hydroxymethylglutaryl-CoA synthase n=1 Tax=Acanthoscelides obtectus TaxID=200917 RepID=A0A9P0P3I9_ACAOB|nr:unnamed protein product [Acanthoscelides obtectus]CAK1656995.1 Hydroxymethylglutaryl-CoA synthase 1 [Acanthoscelides obtectus]